MNLPYKKYINMDSIIPVYKYLTYLRENLIFIVKEWYNMTRMGIIIGRINMPKSMGDFIYKDISNTPECKSKYYKYFNKEVISLSKNFI